MSSRLQSARSTSVRNLARLSLKSPITQRAQLKDARSTSFRSLEGFGTLPIKVSENPPPRPRSGSGILPRPMSPLKLPERARSGSGGAPFSRPTSPKSPKSSKSLLALGISPPPSPKGSLIALGLPAPPSPKLVRFCSFRNRGNGVTGKGGTGSQPAVVHYEFDPLRLPERRLPGPWCARVEGMDAYIGRCQLSRRAQELQVEAWRQRVRRIDAVQTCGEFWRGIEPRGNVDAWRKRLAAVPTVAAENDEQRGFRAWLSTLDAKAWRVSMTTLYFVIYAHDQKLLGGFDDSPNPEKSGALPLEDMLIAERREKLFRMFQAYRQRVRLKSCAQPFKTWLLGADRSCKIRDQKRLEKMWTKRVKEIYSALQRSER